MAIKTLLLIENSRAYGRGLLRGIARYARIHGPWDFVTKPDYYSRPPINETIEDFKSFLEDIKGQQLDGMIVRELPPAFMRSLAEIKIPAIIIPYLNEFPDSFINRLITDSESIAEMAAKYFLEKGFKNFAYCGYDTMFWSEKRKKYFKNYLNKNGFELFLYSNPDQIKAYHLHEDRERMSKWLWKLPKPIGLLSCTDDRGLQVLDACRLAKIKVPEEVSIVGVDNDDLVCNLSSVGISSIDLSTEDAGYEAAAKLEDLINNKTFDSLPIKVLPKRVITRQSSDILAIEDNDIALAIKFIRENNRKIVKVEDVVSATSSSRRVLEKKFSNILNRTIAQEIRRFKTDKISELLTETDLPIKKIANITGFETQKHFSRYFSKEKNISPQKYRKNHSFSKIENIKNLS